MATTNLLTGSINWDNYKPVSLPQVAPSFNLGSVKDVPTLNAALHTGQINSNQWMTRFKQLQPQTPKIQTGVLQNLNPFNKQSVVNQQEITPVKNTLVGAYQQAQSQAQYLTGPRSTQAQRDSIMANQKAAQTNPAFLEQNIKTSNPTGAGIIQHIKNDVVSAYQHANPFSGVNAANSLISKTQQAYGLTPSFVKTLQNANTSLTGKTLANGQATGLTTLPGKLSNNINRSTVSTAPFANGKTGNNPVDTLVHEGLHQVWAANPQIHNTFATAYNQSTNPVLQQYLRQTLNINPKVNLSNFSKLPPALQDEVHSQTVHFYTTAGNPVPNNPLVNYYNNFVNVKQAAQSNSQTSLPKGVNPANLQEYSDSSGNKWYEDSKGNKYPIGVRTTPKSSGGLAGVLDKVGHVGTGVVKGTTNFVAQGDKAVGGIANTSLQDALHGNNSQTTQNAMAARNRAEAQFLPTIIRPIAQIGETIAHPLTQHTSATPTSSNQTRVLGTRPVQNIQKGVGGTYQTGRAEGENPVVAGARGLAYGLGQAAQDVETVGALYTGVADSVVKTGGNIKAAAGKDQTVQDLITNTHAQNLSQAIERAKQSVPVPRSALDNHIAPVEPKTVATEPVQAPEAKQTTTVPAKVTEPPVAQSIVNSKHPITQAFNKHYTPSTNPTPEENFAANYIRSNPDKAIADYNARVQDKFGTDKIVAGDEAKHIIPGFDSTKSVAYHEPGSALAKVKNDQLLADKSTTNQPVLQMSGGTGAGKTSALLKRYSPDEYAATVDTNSNVFGSAKNKIDQALQSGREVDLAHVHRDIIDAFKNGVIPRTVKEGRLITPEDHINTHFGANEVFKQLQEHYKDNPKVHFSVFENKTGESPKELENIPKIGYTKDEAIQQLRKEVESAHEQGKITTAERNAYLAKENPRTSTARQDNAEHDTGNERSVSSQKENLKNSGSSLKSEQRAVEKGLVDDLGDKATYKGGSYKTEAAKAVQLTHDDPDKATQIATGEKAGDNTIHEVAVRRAVENKALNDGDINTIQKLAQSSQHTETSEAAQRLGAEGFNAERNSPVQAIKEISAARTKAMIGSGDKATQTLSSTVKDIQKTVAPKLRVSRQDWHSFISDLQCK